MESFLFLDEPQAAPQSDDERVVALEREVAELRQALADKVRRSGAPRARATGARPPHCSRAHARRPAQASGCSQQQGAAARLGLQGGGGAASPGAATRSVERRSSDTPLHR